MQQTTRHCIRSSEVIFSNDPEIFLKKKHDGCFFPLTISIYWMPNVSDGLSIHRRELGYTRLSPCSFSSNTEWNISKTRSTAFFQLDRQSVCSNWPCWWEQELVILMAMGRTSLQRHLSLGTSRDNSEGIPKQIWSDLFMLSNKGLEL